MILNIDHHLKPVFLFVAALTFFGCASVPFQEKKTAEIAVTAFHDEIAFSGTDLYLVEDIEQFPAEFSYVARTGKDGKGVFPSVREGAYYLIGKGINGGDGEKERRVFGYFGGNPLSVSPGEKLDLVLPLVGDAGKGDRAPAESAAIAGTVVHGGKSVENCYIFAYSDPSSNFRDPQEALVGLSSGAGYFEIDALPGSYYLVARKRKSGGFAGPLGKGDYFGYFPGNPVTLKEGERLTVTFPLVLLKMRNAPLYAKKGVATISGRIVDESGQGVAGAYAALYDNPELLNRPLIVSPESAQDGRFLINVPGAGVYYLGARTGYGGAPGPGDLYGRYEGTVDHSIEVGSGDEISGIVITVSEVW
ncbi:MAG: hypothetical protein GTN70_10535 [Deltaproteobacteria bacterium]|nr:hypothetical protein [Deltaproteobacteria bacterium]NIS78127.1 hypothetical protein [Deltaproteobacteria bacterium]